MKKLYSLCSHVVNYFLLIIYFLFCNYILAFGQTQTIAITGPSSTSGPVILTVQINPPNDCSVQLLPATLTIQTTNTQQFTATTAGCSPNTVTWTVNGVLGGDATHGTVSVGGLYTAPNAVPGPATVTVTSTSVANNARSASASVTIAPPTPPCSVSIVPTSASVNTGATQQFTATTQTCTPSTVHWQVNSITGGNSTIGTISNTGLYTAPSVLPSPNTVTISAVSNQDNTTHANATVTLNASLSCSIGITPQIVTLFVTNTQQFTASTSNCTPNTATWQVNGIVGGNSTVGTISVGGLYTAPASVPSPSSVNVTAVSVADATKTATAQVTISTAAANLDELYSGVGNTWIGSTTDGGATLPTTSYLTSRVATPSPGVLHSGLTTLTTVQGAINNAACGDIIEVPFGTDLGNGTITLPQKTPACDDSHYIWLRSSGVGNVAWPSEGSRITPCQAGKASIPNRTAYPCSNAQNLMFKITATNGSSCVIVNGDHYKITGMECTRVTTPGIVFILVDVAKDHFILEQNYIHGINQDGHWPVPAGSQTDVQHAIFIRQVRFTAIKDNYFQDMYCTGLCTDSQVVAGGAGGITNSGWGALKVVNNHIEASGEGMLLGGSGGPALTPLGCTITVNCNLDVPTDIEVRLNYFYKPLTWDGNTIAGGPGGAGWPVEKNGFEMKVGARALFESNIIENTWYHAQVGWCFSVAPKNQSNNAGTLPTDPTALTNDFTYRYNYCYKTANGPGIYQTQDANCPTCQAQGMNRISVHDNILGDALFIDACSPTSCSTGDGIDFTASKDTSNQGLNKLQNVNVQHNTIVKTLRDGIGFGASANNLINNFTFQNNVLYSGNYDVLSNPSLSGCSTTNNFYTNLNQCIPALTWTVDHNYDFNWNGGINNNGALGHGWPTNGSGLNNSFSTGTTTVGFTSYSVDSNFTPLNYLPTNGSPLHNAGSDGKDIGADVVTLNNKLPARY